MSDSRRQFALREILGLGWSRRLWLTFGAVVLLFAVTAPFGTDRIGWTDTNNAGLTRSFDRFSEAIDEVVDARVWTGIHFRNADEQGAKIGRQVAGWRERHYFRAVHGRNG